MFIAFSRRARETFIRRLRKAIANPVLFMPPLKPQRKARQPSLTTFVVRIGPPKLTRFEKARIVGARSLQIAMGAPPFIAVGEANKGPIEVATAELEEDALPLSIRRSLPNGATQDIPLTALIK
jgi:DNA-directed RNA polymerase subunit K/omega